MSASTQPQVRIVPLPNGLDYTDVVGTPAGTESRCRYKHETRAEARTCAKLRSTAASFAPSPARLVARLAHQRGHAATARVVTAVERLSERAVAEPGLP